MREEISGAISDICNDLFNEQIAPELTRPDEKFGDYATNVALQLAAKVDEPPREVAEKIIAKLAEKNISASIAGPGFINITLSEESLLHAVQNSTDIKKSKTGQVIVSEYSDPNPFKILHAGHLYTTLVGDAISNILEQAGSNVHRVNFGGDVGLHVAKSMYAILKNLGGENPNKLGKIADSQKLHWLSERYVEGNSAHEKDEQAKIEINELNKRIYSLHTQGDKTSDFAKIYWTCRQWSYDGFEDFYAKLKVHKFEKYYPESSVSELGLQTVKTHTGKVYEESDGAVVYRAEKYGLHTRVFITKEGLPTYEAKDVGLSIQKYRDYKFDKSIIITANEIMQYMQVVVKSIEQFESNIASNTIHLNHGMVKLSGGVKMSSRLGNFLTAEDVLEAAKQASKQIRGDENADITLGAVKYALLKNSIGGDIIYDPKESVSLEGKSGPYLQYALVRAKSIFSKTSKQKIIKDLEKNERSLARKISEYPEIFAVAVEDLSPHHICNYLYELAQVFNRFYEKDKVIGHDREAARLALINKYSDVLEHGLTLLGIPQPKEM